MAFKFYVTMIRGERKRRVAVLAGPYESVLEAEGHVDEARRKAEEIDPFSCFDAFGVTGYDREIKCAFGKIVC